MSTRRKLITYDEARPAKEQHKKPCSDCPFARDALPGWLGSHTIEEWVLMVHGENYIECHTLTGAQCAGAAIYRKNVAKLPIDKRILLLPTDHQRVFSSPREFVDHHSRVGKL
jgi:hypothetical protein